MDDRCGGGTKASAASVRNTPMPVPNAINHSNRKGGDIGETRKNKSHEVGALLVFTRRRSLGPS